MTPAQIAIDAIRKLTFGDEVRFENLAMIPLLASDAGSIDYLTLGEALASSSAEITEINDAGQVSQLRITVKGDRPVLLVDGEELVGAKQNRVLNLTILAPAHQETVIPVSCVEAGRWHRTSPGFAEAARTQFSEARAAKIRQVTMSMESVGSRTSNQRAVWDLIAEKARHFDALSDTAAMSAVFERLATPLEAFVNALVPREHQVGAMFLINGVPAGLDAFDSAATWRTQAAKIVRGYAVDALDRRRQAVPTTAPHSPQAILDALAAATSSAFPAVGEGEDVRFTGADLAGAALVAHGRAIHVSAFPAERSAKMTPARSGLR